MELPQINDINKLADKYRWAKLKFGDYRGMKNKFELAKKLGIAQMEVAYYSMGGMGKKIVEISFEMNSEDLSTLYEYGYSLTELLKALKENKDNSFNLTLTAVVWNEKRTEADRKNVYECEYKPSKV